MQPYPENMNLPTAKKREHAPVSNSKRMHPAVNPFKETPFGKFTKRSRIFCSI